MRIVTPGYLQAMGIRLREGRDFTWQDTPKSEPVIVINETAARRHWPGESPIGDIAHGIGDGDTKVVGVVSDVRVRQPRELRRSEMYLLVTEGNPEGSELVVRSKLPPDVAYPYGDEHAAQAESRASPMSSFGPSRRWWIMLCRRDASL